MNTFIDASELSEATASGGSAADQFDPSAYFEEWLKELKPDQKTPEPLILEEQPADIFVDFFPGSDCEVTFEGVFRFDGHSHGSISSSKGTLVLSEGSRVEGDISVQVALINGYVAGNLTATERVVLESEARVAGRILTPGLSVMMGAVFDGDCLVTRTAIPSEPELSGGETKATEPKYLAVGAAA